MRVSCLCLYPCACCAVVLLLSLSGWTQMQSPDRFNAGNSTGIPLYPKAQASDHADGRGTVSMSDQSEVHRLAAAAYFSGDRPEKVLQFYRERLKQSGALTECSGGTNRDVDVQLTVASFADPAACNAEDFAAGGTELKTSGSGGQKIVVVSPHGGGSEIALVSVRP